MTKITSSANRLYNILKQFQEYQNGENITRIWGEILGAKNPDDPVEVSELLSELFLLCKQVKLDLKSLENPNKHIYLNAIKRIEFFLLNQSLIKTDAAKITQLQNQIHPDTLGMVLASADLISMQQLAFQEIDSELLEELKQKIVFLQDEIKRANIEIAIKKFLKQQLNKIEEAIELYPIRGSSGLDRATKEVLGEIFLVIWRLSKQEKEITVKFMQFLSPIHTYINLEERLQHLPNFIKKCLNLYHEREIIETNHALYNANKINNNNYKPIPIPSNNGVMIDDFRLF